MKKSNILFILTILCLFVMGAAVYRVLTVDELTVNNTTTLSGTTDYLPKAINGIGMLCPTGNGLNLFTNTLSYGCTNLHVGDNVAFLQGSQPFQFEICEVVDDKTIRVFETIFTNTVTSPLQMIATNTAYQIYPNAANFYDINGKHMDSRGFTHGALASDGGIIVSPGPIGLPGWDYGYRLYNSTNNARITLSLLGVRGPVMDFESGGTSLAQGNPFYWSLWAPYESLGIMSNGIVAARFGFTNNFGPLLTYNVTTNQFGDGVQAILRGPDSNFQIVLRENANRWNDYYSFGDIYANGGGHRFSTRGFGADKTEFVVAIDSIYSGVPVILESTNGNWPSIGANQVGIFNSNQVIYGYSTTKTNVLLDLR